MAVKRIFLLSSGQLTVFQWDAGRMAEPFTFMADENGLTEFSSYLDETSTDPVHLLLDVVEEEFREETIPHVFAADRSALIRTKSNRLFRETKYTHAIVQGRQADGRRDDNVLFTAVIRPDLLSPWMGQVIRHKVPLAGIFSLPLVTQHICKKIDAVGEHVLLVSLQSAGGLRQTFFQNQQLKLSRLAIIPKLDAAQYASYILAEIEKIRRYLNSLRLVSRDSPLEVFILSQGSMLEDLSRQTADSITTNHHFIDVGEVAMGQGFKDPYTSPFSDALFAHVLAKTPMANHYANADETRYFSMYQARKFMKVASILLLVGGAGVAGFQFVEGAIASQETIQTEQQTVFYDDRYQMAREQLPKSPAEANELIRVINTVDDLRKYRASPQDMMVLLSQGLEAFPSLQIDSMSWTVSADPFAPVSGRAALKGEPPAGTVAVDEEGNNVPALFQLAFVGGSVVTFDGDYRLAIDQVNGFADALSLQNSVEHVQILTLPLDLSSERVLSGGSEQVTGKAEFEIRVALRLETKP